MGADWEPVFVDFFRQGVPRTGGYVERERDGRGAGTRARCKETHANLACA